MLTTMIPDGQYTVMVLAMCSDTSVPLLKRFLPVELGKRLAAPVKVTHLARNEDDDMLVLILDFTKLPKNEFFVGNEAEIKKMFEDEIRAMLEAATGNVVEVVRIHIDYAPYVGV